MTENTSYYKMFIEEKDINNYVDGYEIRYYQYPLNKFMISEPIIKESIEFESELEMMIEFMNHLKTLSNDPDKHFYIWALKNEYAENRDGESDLYSSEIMIYLTNDISRLKEPKKTMYNHVDKRDLNV